MKGKVRICVTLMLVVGAALLPVSISGTVCPWTDEDYWCGYANPADPGTCQTCDPFIWTNAEGDGNFYGLHCVFSWEEVDWDYIDCMEVPGTWNVDEYGWEAGTQHCPDTCGTVELIKVISFHCNGLYVVYCDH
jgi:hypothetical protein